VRIMPRDIQIMRWIHEQKFMTERQIRQVFWKGVSENSREDYKRLSELEKAGYLKRSKQNLYRYVLYMVSAKGIRQLKGSGHEQGLGEIHDVDYSLYRHDMAVTDLRILFHVWGNTEWVCERVLSKRNDLRHLPDAMIYHQGKYLAVEYESSRKSKRRYDEIFLDYQFDRQIQAILYVVDTKEMAERLCRVAALYGKIFFATLQELVEQKLDAQLKRTKGLCVLKRLLEGQMEAHDQIQSVGRKNGQVSNAQTT